MLGQIFFEHLDITLKKELESYEYIQAEGFTDIITNNSKASGNSKTAIWENLHEVLRCSFQDLPNIKEQINNRELVSSYITNSYSILEIVLLRT